MRNFQDKRKFNKFLESKFFLIAFFILLIFFAWSLIDFMHKMQETAKNKKIAKNKVAELIKTKERLNIDIEKLENQKGIEESLREKFGLGKEGEELIIILDDEEDKNKSATNVTNKEFKVIFYDYFKNLFDKF